MSLTSVSGDGPLGHGTFLRILTSGTNATEGTFYGAAGQLSVTAGEPYIASVWVRGTGTVHLRVNFTAGGSVISGASVVLTAAWQQLVVTATPTATTSAHMLVETVSAEVATIETGAWQFEHGAYPTDYLDGEMGAGFDWVGTAHQSAATRAAGRVAFPARLLSAISGGIAMRWQPRDGDPFPRDRALFELPTDGGAFTVRPIAASNVLRLTSPRRDTVDDVAPAFVADQRLTITAGWTPSALHVGIDEQQTVGARTPGGWQANGWGELGSAGAGEQANGVIGPVWWFEAPPPAAARRVIVRSPGAPVLGGAILGGAVLGSAMPPLGPPR